MVNLKEQERAEKQQLSRVFRYYPSLCLEGVNAVSIVGRIEDIHSMSIEYVLLT
jgi:hypothetical protein